ncbi:putative F-box domain-containing protein [Seiridium unicorne]|uniref:F-box domain-containing protein n=1 Tax=Seiridium unicorne TaxID=138068 RepID=A0ABR2VBI7_9PEZI
MAKQAPHLGVDEAFRSIQKSKSDCAQRLRDQRDEAFIVGHAVRHHQTNAMKAALDHLPIEILTAILKQFCVHCQASSESPDAYSCGNQQQPSEPSWYSLDRHALFSLCLTSRNLLEPAQAILYHEFMPGYGDSWRTTRYTWAGRLTNFLCTISRRPDLAAMVKRVHIDPKLMFFVSPEECKTAIGLAAAKFMIGLPEFADYLDGPESWSPFSWKGNHYVDTQFSRELIHMLVLQLPELEHISFKTSYLNRQTMPRPRPIPSTAFRATTQTGPSIKRIAAAQDKGSSTDLDSFSSTLVPDTLEWIPPGHLQELHLHMVTAGGSLDLPSLSLINLKTLRITSSRITRSALSSILSSIQALETFIYESAPTRNGTALDHRSESINDAFEPYDAVNCLQRHQASLIRLHLQMSGYKCPGVSNFGTGLGLVTSLRDFSLKHLLINAEAICNSPRATPEDAKLLESLLPTSLESLALSGNIYYFPFELRLVNGLLGLADAVMAERYPHLKRITCDEVMPMDKYDTHGIPDSFRAGGVVFELSSWPLSKPTRSGGEDFWPDGVSPTRKAVELPPEDDDEDL